MTAFLCFFLFFGWVKQKTVIIVLFLLLFALFKCKHFLLPRSELSLFNLWLCSLYCSVAKV